MTQSKQKKGRLVIGLFCVIAGIVAPAFDRATADVMQSTNFKIESDDISVGGGSATSTGFVMDDTIGGNATGEGLSSANFKGCAGYQCFTQSQYISFSINTGTTSPGTAGGGVALGELTPAAVKGSNHSDINSIFLLGASNGNSTIITVKSDNGGLHSSATGATIASASGPITASVAAYGLCVNQAGTTGFDAISPYSGTCDISSGNTVGIVDSTTRTILMTTGQVENGVGEVLIKAAVSGTTVAASDYTDNLTFIMTSTY